MQEIQKGLFTVQENKSLTIIGGIAGMLSVISYLTIAFTSLPDPLVFFLAMMFPILGIVFLFSIKEYVNIWFPSHIGNLAFIFGSLAFTLCAIMLSAQMAVQIGIDLSAEGAESQNLKIIKQSLRLIDLGIDVAWDMFITTYLVLFAFSVQKLKALRWWGAALGVMGIGLMLLNTMTFPNPPAESGYFDLGPFIAMTLMLLGAQMLRLGLKIKS
jgi:hypothetical protein